MTAPSPQGSGALLDPLWIIADAIMRQSGTIPSKATVAKAQAALDALADAGWAIVPSGKGAAPPTVWATNDWHTPSVSHGFEVIGVWTSKELAERHAVIAKRSQDAFNARLDARDSISTRFHREFDVEEWTVDDLRLLETEAGG